MNRGENYSASKKQIKTCIFTQTRLEGDYLLSNMITFCFLYRKNQSTWYSKNSCRWHRSACRWRWIQDWTRRPHHPIHRSLRRARSSPSDAGNKYKQNGSKSSSISQWLIVHLQVRQHATRCANLIREITFANADKVFINRLPLLKNSAVTVFSLNWMHLTSAALRYLWRVSFGIKSHIALGKLPRNI